MSQLYTDLEAYRAAIDTHTNTIATVIQSLLDQLAAGMSQAEIDQLKADMAQEVAKLQALAATDTTV